MLNRLFIVIGVLCILAISAAFLVPRLINWGDYRGRMEAVASEALGAPVRMTGDIAFQLLPQPLLTFNDVEVGAPGAPALTVAHVEAEFSLLDFLRDRYQITRLVLEAPKLEFAVGLDGSVTSGIAPAPQMAETNLSIENATIHNGTVILADARAGVARAEAVDGELKLTALGGAFGFAGKATVAGRAYKVRFNTTAFDAGGKARLTLFGQTADEATTLSGEGEFVVGSTPQFSGDLTLRRRPPAAREDLVQGDLVVTGSVEASFDHILLSSYTIVPDENRAGTRLTGAARLALGAEPKFDAVISGGVLALPPRDPTTEEPVAPYELVRLLRELPTPPVPGVQGSIGVDIAEVNLRALALRDVRFDAVSGGDGWTVRNFKATLPGNGALKLDGMVTVAGERPHFEGHVAIDTTRLDALAALWRKPEVPNPLFGIAAGFSAGVVLDDQSLSLSDGLLNLDGEQSRFGAVIGFDGVRRIDFSADLGALDRRRSAVIAALLPDLSPAGSFGVTFPTGTFTVAASQASVMGLDGTGLALEGGWEGGVLEIKKLAAEDLGGARFDLATTIFGTVAHPELSGSGTLAIAEAGSPLLTRLLDAAALPTFLRDAIGRSLPADVAVKLDPPGGDGSQALTVVGSVGTGQLNATAQLSAGLARAVGSPFGLKLDLVSADVAAMTAQLGLGAMDLLAPAGPLHVALSLEGAPSNSLETTLAVESAGDSVGFTGNLVVSDPARWSGRGVIKATLADPGGLAEALGAGGIGLPGLAGTAQLNFTGLDNIQLSAIDARAAGARVAGTLELLRQQSQSAVTGTLELGEIPAQAVVATLVGPAGMIPGGTGVWPEGPIGGASAPRTTTGHIEVTADAISLGPASALTAAQFDVDWDAQALKLRNFTGTIGGGSLTLDAGLCCAGPATQRTLSTRIGVTGVDVGALLPAAAAAQLGGSVSGAAQLEGTGDSLAAIAATLAGEGSFAVKDFRVAGFDAGTFATVAALPNILDMQPDDLAMQIRGALAKGPFTAPEVAGSFTVAGGVVRSPNLAVQGTAARLFGGGTLRLGDFALDGAYTLTPVGNLGTDGFINETSAQVVARLGGTLLQPQPDYDVAGMVDAIQIHAYEVELAELERLRAEDEARVKAAQLARARDLGVSMVQIAGAFVGGDARDAMLKLVGDAAEAAATEKQSSIDAAEAAAQKAAESARRAAQQPAATSAPAPTPAPVPAPLVLTPAEPATRF